MKRKVFLIALSVFLLAGCGKIPTLKNGEQAVVSIDGGGISANELYEEIKDKYGLQALVSMIDTQILEKEFKSYKANANEKAISAIESMKNEYGGEDALLQAIKTYTNYTSIEDYQKEVYLGYLREHATLEYAKTQVTDKEIESYYKDNVYGDVSVKHILITINAKSNATDEEKKAAEDKAKDKANEVINKLNTAKKNSEKIEDVFNKLVKEYSEDDATKSKNGDLGYINYNKLDSSYDELVSAALKLKNGEYSTKVITTSLGYHVIYRVNQKEKASLDKLKSEIKETLAQNKVTNEQTVSVDAIQFYRDKYNVKINDSELQKQYSNYMQALVSQSMNSNN